MINAFTFFITLEDLIADTYLGTPRHPTAATLERLLLKMTIKRATLVDNTLFVIAWCFVCMGKRCVCCYRHPSCLESRRFCLSWASGVFISLLNWSFVCTFKISLSEFNCVKLKQYVQACRDESWVKAILSQLEQWST